MEFYVSVEQLPRGKFVITKLGTRGMDAPVEYKVDENNRRIHLEGVGNGDSSRPRTEFTMVQTD